VAFTTDGDRLVSVSGDGTGLVWDVFPLKLSTRAFSDAQQEKRRAALLWADGGAAYRAMTRWPPTRPERLRSSTLN
jgi:WD40 repeat protein